MILHYHQLHEEAGDPGGEGGAGGNGSGTPDPHAAALAERDAKLVAMESRLQSALSTLESVTRGGGGGGGGGGAPPTRGGIPAHIRQQILSRGMSEADLEANAPLIVPLIEAYLGTAANEVLGMIQELRDDHQVLTMPRQRDPEGRSKYEFYDAVESDVQRIRADAKKQGRYIDPDTAYHIAVAQNHGKLSAAPAATTRSADVTATSGLRTVRAAAPPEPTPVKSAQDLSTMSRAERAKFFEANSETPVRSG